jgi:hypothetical protein
MASRDIIELSSRALSSSDSAQSPQLQAATGPRIKTKTEVTKRADTLDKTVKLEDFRTTPNGIENLEKELEDFKKKRKRQTRPQPARLKEWERRADSPGQGDQILFHLKLQYGKKRLNAQDGWD